MKKLLLPCFVTVLIASSFAQASQESLNILLSHLNLSPGATLSEINEQFALVAADYEEDIRTGAGGSPEWHYRDMKQSYIDTFGMQPPAAAAYQPSTRNAYYHSPSPREITFNRSYYDNDAKGYAESRGWTYVNMDEIYDTEGNRWRFYTLSDVTGVLEMVQSR